MKTYSKSFADSISHIPSNPERTATKSIGFDVLYKEWSNQKAMLKTIEMQENAGTKNAWRAWRPRVKAELVTKPIHIEEV